MPLSLREEMVKQVATKADFDATLAEAGDKVCDEGLCTSLCCVSPRNFPPLPNDGVIYDSGKLRVASFC